MSLTLPAVVAIRAGLAVFNPANTYAFDITYYEVDVGCDGRVGQVQKRTFPLTNHKVF
ncbi:hypothetical protein PR003_g15146 [Phytophthora rubi]|uniref:Uncharacterized protein n=1 Tax=Phytophthora rubi TaxID=129364 RepID=A0A6A3LIU6_9STRA|nr:hypothetical protein PR002_g14801 [Phytophthora rubi]KAE9017897.1 hypothetical protein PR001_g14284 [Phytophthora rubi]KAE9331168.1 hypothetical protein PR003_g15146 [Phytophthora rubi]